MNRPPEAASSPRPGTWSPFQWFNLKRDWPYLFVTLTPLLLFAPFLLGRQVMYWGTPLLQFYPWRRFALDAIRSGHLPLWNPYLGNGAPLIANHQSAVFYPPNWISLLLPLDYSLGWLAALHLIWAGTGMVTLSRALGLRSLGQVVAGLAFGASQYLVARAGFISINAAAAWLPWIIWAGDRLLSPQSLSSNLLKRALLLSLCLSLQLLAGHAQTAWYTLLLLIAWVLWRVITHLRTYPLPRTSQRPVTFLSPLLLVGLAVAFALLLAALQLLPTAELLQQSSRAASAEYEFVVTYSFSPWRVLTLLAPDLLGNPARGWFYGYGNYWEDAVYVGLLPFLLAVSLISQTILSGYHRRTARAPLHPAALSPDQADPPSSTPGHGHARALVYFLTLTLLAALLLALGRNTPVFPFFYKYVPTFNLFQAPARMMIWFVFALALLAGLAADRWEPPQRRALYWTRLGVAGAVSIVLVGAFADLALPATGKLMQQLHTVARAVALCGFGLLIAASLSLLKPKMTGAPAHSSTTWWQLAVALFLCADLLFAGYGLNPGAPPDLYRAPTASGAILRAAVGDHRLFQFPDDEHNVKFERYLSFTSFGPPEFAHAVRESQLPNVSLLDGLYSASNFDPLLNARYTGLVEVISATRSLNLLRLMDVAVVVSSVPLDLEPIAQGSATTFYRVPGEPRRVRVVYTARIVADAEAARAALAHANFDPASEVLLEADDPGVTPASPCSRVSLTPSPNVVTITASLEQPGWVVLSDAYYPGWCVFVDGQPAKLLHADYAFRAVPAEAGNHTLEFRYAPRSFYVGLWVSIASWLILSVAALWLWRRSA